MKNPGICIRLSTTFPQTGIAFGPEVGAFQDRIARTSGRFATKQSSFFGWIGRRTAYSSGCGPVTS